jgi:MerR family transcriptional regulator/heat shock protein HspR
MTDDRNRPLFMISVAAELAGLHPQTLRIYEARGLVSPQRSAGNTRLYSQADIDKLELIGQLTDEGINLAGVMRIIDLQSRLERLSDENETLRRRLGKFEQRCHEYELRSRITALAHTEGTAIRLFSAEGD